MPSYIPLPKLEFDALELLFYTHFVCVSSRNIQSWDRMIPYFRFKYVRKCVFAYMVAVFMVNGDQCDNAATDVLLVSNKK